MATEHLPIVILRFGLAFLAGSIIGWEREVYEDVPVEHKGSVYRIYTMVCLGACIFTVAGQFGFANHISSPDRIASNVVTGVGFLGAGMILKDSHGEVRGLPSAVGIWISASIGVLVGAGNYWSGVIAAGLTYFIMDFPHRFPKLFDSKRKKNVE